MVIKDNNHSAKTLNNILRIGLGFLIYIEDISQDIYGKYLSKI